MGYDEYLPIAAPYKLPIVVTGFETLDILEGIRMTVGQLEEGRPEVENQYSRAVRREGNRPAQEPIAEVFEVTNQQWRGLGEIPASGFQLRGRSRNTMPTGVFPRRANPCASRRSASAG
jgi:hydrogenase expression/formation protein HypD